MTRCPTCLDTGHVCENHPDRPWAYIARERHPEVEECCGGAGMACPACCSPIPTDGTRSIVEAFTPDHLRTPTFKESLREAFSKPVADPERPTRATE